MEWNQRRDEKDLVGLLETGSGKTLIGLLVLMSKMREYNLPVIYSLPTKQLVKQTVEQSINYGIPVTESADEDFYNADVILVTTFETVFNGRSIFGVKGQKAGNEVELGAIVIDDAHAAAKRAEAQATVTVKKSDESDKYNSLLTLFKNELLNQSRMRLDAIEKGNSANLVLKVPFWTVQRNKNTIFDVLMTNEKDDFGFHAPFVMDYLDKSEVVVSSSEIAIRPRIIPIDLVQTLFNAKHRLFMSATMVRPEKLLIGLGVDVSAIKNPIDLTESGLTEGMKLIFNPTAFDKNIDRLRLMELIRSGNQSSKENVVVLVPSNAEAKIWHELGADVFTGDSIDSAVRRLKDEPQTSKWYVFVNRYEGIDLNGNASHILIMDGSPKNFDVFEKSKVIHGSDVKTIHRIQAETFEQGVGRTVRDNTDYSLVIIFGQELTALVNRRDFRSHWSKKLQTQRLLGEKLTRSLDKEARNSLVMDQIIQTFLKREESFSNLYVNQLKALERDISSPIRELNGEEKLSLVYENFQKSAFDMAETKLNEIISEEEEGNKKGELFELKAEIINFKDEVAAQKIQANAKSLNDSLFMPKSGNIDQLKKRKKHIEAAKFAYNTLVNRYDNAEDFQQVAQQILDRLSFDGVKFKDFERSMQAVGEFLGFISERPDNSWNEGPDNLWLSENVAFIFEDKNEATAHEFSKDYFGQLEVSENWTKQQYPFREVIPVAVYPTKIAHNDIKTAIKSSSVKVIDRKLLESMVDKLHKYVQAIVANFDQIDPQFIQEHLEALNLTESGLKRVLLKSVFK